MTGTVQVIKNYRNQEDASIWCLASRSMHAGLFLACTGVTFYGKSVREISNVKEGS